MLKSGPEFGIWLRKNSHDISPLILPALNAIRNELLKTDDSLAFSPLDELVLTGKSGDSRLASEIVSRMREKVGIAPVPEISSAPVDEMRAATS